MNVSQANHTLQQNPTGESAQEISEISDGDAFLDQLTLAQDGPEWFTETDVKTEKERVNEEQQAKRRESEDLEDVLVVNLASQGYVNNLKQSDAMETARVISESENRDRLMQHVEKKHLHTPTVVEEGDVNKAENSFSKVITGELEGAKNNASKDITSLSANPNADDLGKSARTAQVKSSEPLHTDMLQRFDAAMARGINPSTSGKAAVKSSEKGVSELSKLSTTEAVGGKSASKNTSARVMSLSGLSETSSESRKSEAGLKAENRSAKQATPVNIKDVVGTVKIMISSKTNEMVMKLAPEHLGKLEIRLKKDGDKLTGRFKVDSREAKEAIETQLPQLKEGLAEQGIHIEEFSVYIKGDDTSNQSFAFNQGQNSEGEQNQQSDATNNEGKAGNQTGENSIASSRNNASGLNIYA